METRTKKRNILRLLLPLVLWLPALVVELAARRSERFAEEVFARGIYRVWHTGVARVTGLLPFSLAEWVLYGFAAAVFAALVVWLLHIIKGKGCRWMIVLRGFYAALCAAGLVFTLFVFGCGGNYYRSTYAECVGLKVEPASPQELYEMCQGFAEHANTLRAGLTDCENADGVFALPCTEKELGERAVRAMQTLGESEPVLAGFYPPPKPVAWSRRMSAFGITGVYFPFTVEANVNVDVTDYNLGADMCHELSHTAGFMREDEANFIAYRACTRSGDPVLAYSGTMLALIHAGNALYEVSPKLYATLRGEYSDAVVRDLIDNSDYWAQFEDSKTTEMGERMNDAYLKANSQSSGIRSYGEMVDLLLAEYRTEQTDE